MDKTPIMTRAEFQAYLSQNDNQNNKRQPIQPYQPPVTKSPQKPKESFIESFDIKEIGECQKCLKPLDSKDTCILTDFGYFCGDCGGHAKCPKCGQFQPDPKGFGVLYCRYCRFCTHLEEKYTENGWFCVICERVTRKDKLNKLAEKQ